MISINELKEMNENERMEWIVNAKSSDLNTILKNEGVKCIPNMKKTEKLAMVVKLVAENSADEDAKRVMEDTKRLKEEIEIRQCYEEKIEGTLYARYKNKEITYNELRKTCDAYNIDIPLSCNEKNSIKLVDENCDLFSWYEHHDDDYTYYSVLSRDYEWYNMYRKNNMCEDWDWDVKKFYEMNTVDKNGDFQLACTFDENCNYMLCMYKNYELLATFVDGDIYDIKVVVDYDDRLTDEDLDTYSELLDLLNEQQDEYCRIVETDKMLKNKLNCTEESTDFIVDEKNKKIIILNSELLK